MPRVNIDGVGQVNFPDDMSQEDIVKAIETEILPSIKATPAPAAKQEAKPAAPAVPVTPTAPDKEIDPTTGKPYPEARALPEKSLFEKFKDLVSRNETEDLKARAANEAAARRAAAERGVPVSQIYKESGGYRPTFNPEGREGIGASIEAATATAKSTKETLPAAANTYLRAVRGGDIPVKDKSWLDRAITATKPEEKVVDKNVEAFANVGESIGYSAATMVASALAGAAANMVSGPIGGVAAGMATSGTLSYSASKDQFLERVKEKLDKESVRLFERPLDEKEWEKAKKDYDSLATQYGAWEAIPEAVSNALMLKAFTAPLKYVNTAEKLSKIALRGVAGQVPEQTSETITALGQNAAELKAGLTKEEMNVADAFRAQFVQSLITTGVMHGGAKTVEASRDFYIKYVEPRVSPGSALGRAIKADIEATALESAQPPQRYTDRGNVAQPPQRPGVEVPPAQPTEVPPIQAAPPAPAAEVVPPAPPTEEPVTPTATLPKDLANAKPRYAYGNKMFELQFESDLDRAAYISAQAATSKRDADYVNFVAQNTGMSEAEVRAHGKAVRNAIKAQAKDGEAGTTLVVPAMATAKAAPAPTISPAVVNPVAVATTPATPEQIQAEVTALTKKFMTEGYAADDAAMLAQFISNENIRSNRVLERKQAADEQRTVDGKAERAEQQILGGDNVTTEPPPFVTQPSTDQYGDGMSSKQQLPAGGTSGPIARGLDASRRLVGQFDSRDEREQDSLNANKQRVQSQVSQAFNREAYPDLGVQLGADWVRQTLSRNPTPEEYQDAAYARLEELNGRAPEFSQPAKETPRVTQAPQAVEAKEERPQAPKPTAPTVEETKTEPAPLELEATRKEEIEVEPPEVKAVVKAEAALPKAPKPRAPGGGRKKSEEAKTQEQRTKDTNAINQFNRDVLTLIGAAKKMQQPTGAFPTTEEYDYAEAARIRNLEILRTKLYALSLVRDPKAGYIAAKNYIRTLKPAELERIKQLHEGTAELRTLPPKPEATLSKYQLEKFRKERYGLEETPSKPSAAPKQAEPKKEKAKETKGTGLNWKTESTEEPIPRFTPTEEEEAEFRRLRKEEMAPTKSLEQQLKDLGEKIEEESGFTEEELGDTQEDLHDVIDEELDEDDRAVLADHYGQDTFNKKAKAQFIADIQLAMREGLEAVSSVLHDIIKKLQAGVLAAVIVMNPNYMSKPMAMAIPMYETKTVQVRAEVPAEAAAKMSEGAKTAYSVIYPAMKAKLKQKDKNFVITDKPTATVFVFDPNGKLVLDSKVLLGLQEGDYFKGDNEIPTNRITPAGGYTLALRDAARGVTDNGGDERRTAGHYDFGKVFVLDKAIEGKASVTLFHSVWTKEKDAKQRLAALEKPGAADSRYSFGCINAPKVVYKYLLDTQQDRMDGALLFVVPENPANTMDFINGKATASKDLTRIKIEPLTTEVKERVPTTPGEKKVTSEAKAITREEESGMLPAGIAFAGAIAARRRKKGQQTNEDVAVDKIIDGSLSVDAAKKMTLSDLAYLTGQAAQIVADEHSTDTDYDLQDMRTLPEALEHIMDTGTPLDAGLAEILLQGENLKAAEKVEVHTVLPDASYNNNFLDFLQEELKDAKGMFVPNDARKKGFILLAHPSYGHTGFNNLTVLHEGVHAVTSMKIEYVQNMIELGRENEVDPKLMDAYKSLEDLMQRAETEYQNNKNPALEKIHEAGAFNDVHEFVAYGMTDSNMKAFLLQMPGTTTKTSGFSSFVNALMKLLGIDPKLQTGFKDFILTTSELMQAKTPSAEKMEAANESNAALVKKAKKQVDETKRATANLEAAQEGSEKYGALNDLIEVARDPRVIKDMLVASWEAMSIPTLKGWLNTMPTDVVVSVGTEAGIGNLKQVYKDIRGIGAYRRRQVKRVTEIAKPWIRLKTKERNKLADIMLFSTDIQIDPSKDKSNPTLNRMWDALTPKAKTIYTEARDFYKNSFNMFNALAMERIEKSSLEGNINDPTTEKGRVAQAIRDTYQASRNINPYFPLMRQGQYWVSFGKKGSYEFYMFDSAYKRSRFISKHMRDLAKKGEKRSFEEMQADGVAEKGNDVTQLQEKAAAAAPMLKKLFDSIDKMNPLDMSVDGKSSLKSDIFQMHLMSLPEGTFRKQFIHRKKIRGYGHDMLRNFVVSGVRISAQIARTKYAPKIEVGLSAAKDSIDKMPNKDRLNMFIREIELRAKDIIDPPQDDSWFATFSKVVNAGVFVYTTTSIKTSVNNLFSFATNGVPTLAKYYGEGAAIKEMGSMLKAAALGNLVGVTREHSDGRISYTWPSLASSKIVRSDPRLIEAVEYMEDMDIVKQNQTYDLLQARKGAAASKPAAAWDGFVMAMGMPFQGTERLVREAMFLSAVKLGLDKGMTRQEALDKAVEVTDEALFNYDAENMPRAMQKPSVRLLAALKRFAYFTTIYHLRNAAQIIKPLKGENRRGAAYALFGSMGMTGLVGAGVYQAFGVSTLVGMYGMLQGLWNLIHGGDEEDQDDEDKALKEMSFQRWFNTVYLPQQYGDVKIGNTKLSDILSSGALSAFTGYDFSSGLSQANLWFKDVPGVSADSNPIMNMVDVVGLPALSVMSNIYQGFQDYAEGDKLKGLEKIIPAALVRNPATAYRYGTEGVVTNRMDVVKYADEFTTMQLLMKALGYNTTGLAETLNMNYVISREKAAIESQRNKLLDLYFKAETRDDEAMLEKLDGKIDKFNDMYPARDLEIRGKDIREYRERRTEAAKKSDYGLTVEKKFDLFDPLRDEGLEKLIKESKN